MARAAYFLFVASIVSALISGDCLAQVRDDAYRGHAAVLRTHCVAFGIPVPVPPVSTLNESAQALVEQALEDTFATGAWFGDIKFGFRQERLIVWMHHRSRSKPWGTNPETLEATINSDATGLSAAAYLSVMRRVIAEVFQQPPETAGEAPPFDPRYALQALGIGLLWRLPTVHTSSGYLKVNTVQAWATVKDAARDLGLTIGTESKPDSTTGRRMIETVSMIDANAVGIQSHYEISLWDPHFGSPAHGTGVRVNVTLVVQRQQDPAGEPLVVKRSGPRQQVLVDSIMKMASRREAGESLKSTVE